MRKTLSKAFLFVATALLVATAFVVASAQPRRPITGMLPADILRIANVSDAQISPNGEWVVYTASTVEGNDTVSSLWLVRVGTNLRNVPTNTAPPTGQIRPTMDWPNEVYASAPLLAGGWNASNPRWSPDSSKIAFLSERNAQRGLWVVSLEKGDPVGEREPRFIAEVQATNFFITYAGEPIAWAPDSKSIAYVSANEDITEIPEAFNGHDDPRVIDRIQYKSRTSFSDRRRTHVWITAVDKPEPRQLTSGYFYDHAISFSPDGDEIAFISNHEADPDANNNSDIFAVDMHGEVRQITATKGCEYEPAWSPDGKWIAYTATKRDLTTIDSVAEDTHVWVTDAAGKERIELTATQDRRGRTPRWTPDSRYLVYLAGDHGYTGLFAVDLHGNKVKPFLPLTLEGNLVTFGFSDVGSAPPSHRYQVSSFTLGWRRYSNTASAQIQSEPLLGVPVVFTLSDPGLPGDVWIFRGGLANRISAHNNPRPHEIDLATPEELRFKSFDGTEIQGWLIKPLGWREDRKYPLILSIHGGPHGMSGWAFNPTFQVYAARGYAVLYLNPRGSSGYGQKFSDGTLNEWGGGDYKDLMAGVDEALRKYPWIDKDRMGVTGGSYGGFMTNWIVTQTPRFKAAVSVASVSNLISFYSTSLYQDLVHAEFGGFPWDNYDLLWQWSPLRYVRQAQTPTLFIHGEQDNDVHITQAEEMYTALKRRGVETVLVRYPREGHGLREPKHRIDALERTLAWFDRFLK
ncbi:MAG: S9 family peptidase [Acidobacteriota bacterium]